MSKDASTTIALLHLAPRAGAIDANKRAVEVAVARAANAGARLIVSPELMLSGYGFRDVVGTGWIAEEQAGFANWAAELARKTSAVLLLGMPEASQSGTALFNSLFVFTPDGELVGRHRKIAVLRVGSESWSSPGDRATVVSLEGIGRVGLFICADMYSRRLVRETAMLDVDLMLSAAAWSEGEHGPSGEWEWASKTAARPVLVCNRTGADVLDFSRARSVAAIGGKIAHTYAAATPAIVLAEWSRAAHAVTGWRTLPAAPP
jgi:predicted amidohydrolase